MRFSFEHYFRLSVIKLHVEVVVLEPKLIVQFLCFASWSDDYWNFLDSKWRKHLWGCTVWRHLEEKLYNYISHCTRNSSLGQYEESPFYRGYVITNLSSLAELILRLKACYNEWALWWVSIVVVAFVTLVHCCCWSLNSFFVWCYVQGYSLFAIAELLPLNTWTLGKGNLQINWTDDRLFGFLMQRLHICVMGLLMPTAINSVIMDS